MFLSYIVLDYVISSRCLFYPMDLEELKKLLVMLFFSSYCETAIRLVISKTVWTRSDWKEGRTNRKYYGEITRKNGR